ncbi:recombinase family protein [Mycobacterium sp.]|jgi:hypothetical protein|uniref:recombinase family protein n=1 Tax=Mycobacterium sp. TaxID=1785 RepID=UPI003341C5CD|nr:site-specific recombinase [Mycobacterium sp.]
MGPANDRLFFGYSRVSTDEQVDSRNGLEAQRSAIDAEAKRRGWTVEHHADKGASGRYINSNLQEALQLLASGQAAGTRAGGGGWPAGREPRRLREAADRPQHRPCSGGG